MTDAEATCIGGVLDGRRKRWVGQTMTAAKPWRGSVIDYPSEPSRPVPEADRMDRYRREVITMHDDGKVEQIPLWIVEGMTRNDAMLHVFHTYGERGK